MSISRAIFLIQCEAKELNPERSKEFNVYDAREQNILASSYIQYFALLGIYL